MALKDPTAWQHDLEFYMTEKSVAESVEATEPILVQGGSKAAVGAWVALVGTLGAVFGAVTLSPGIRRALVFAGYVVVAALLLRGLHPLTVRFLGRGAAWVAMFAFFWTFLLGVIVMIGAGFESRWAAYGFSVGGGFFIGMMYGSFPPSVVKDENMWMLSFLIAPVSALASTYFLRHMAAADTVQAALATGVVTGILLMVPMAALMVRLWDESAGLFELGEVYLHNDTFAAEAVAYLDRAIAMKPNEGRYYTLRGVGLSRMNEPERAAADWAKASELSPNDPEPHVYRGVDCLRRGANQDAIQTLNVALEKNPKHGRAHVYLGAAWERLGDLNQAFEHYNKAVTLAPDDAKVRCDRSYAHFRQGDYEKALKDADRAVRLESRLGLGYAAAGQALAMLGRAADARSAFEEAIDLGVEPAVHQDVLRRLESLGGGDEVEAEG